jgi:hypothetical protein
MAIIYKNLYFHSLTFALQENGPFSKSCEVAAFPAAASCDEIEQLRVQAVAAVRSYSEARAAAEKEAIYQAGIAPSADAQVGSTADNAKYCDEVEPLRLHGAAAIGACRETRAAARRKAINQAAVAPPVDAHSGLTADCASADLRLIFKSALQKSLKRMAARGI